MANLSNINNVLRVSSNLRVGINTDAASYALEIGGTNSGIKLKNSGGSGKVYSILSDTSGNFQIYDDAAASGRLVINSAGNATFAGTVTGGNGTFTNLTISATEKLRFDGAGGHTYIEEDSNDTLIFATGGTTRLTLNANATFAGQVQVNKVKSGTGVENYDLIRLNLSGTGAVGDSSTIGWFSTSGTKTAGIEGISGLDNILYGELAFHVRRYTTDTYDEVMRINNRGNVGIGTASPVFKLDIRTSTPGDRAVLGVNSATSGTNYGGQFNSQGSGATKNIGLYATAEGATTNYAGIFDSGNVGIGTTSPTSKLHLRDPAANSDIGIKIGNDSRDWNLKVMGSVSDSLQFFTHDNSNVMTILPSGYVGIGTDSPTSQLFVNNTADGDKIRWGRSDALVGSVGTYNGVPYIGYQGGAGGGIMFNGSSIEPTALGSTRSSSTNDIGSNSYKWRNIYLSGGAYLGGTGSANHLDDYEEGTWTPTISHNNGTGAIPLTVTGGAYYVKVGRLVEVFAYLTNVNPNGNAGGSGPYYAIRSLPFAAINHDCWSVAYANNNMTSYGGYAAGDNLYFMKLGTNGQCSNNHVNGTFFNTWGTFDFMFKAVYQTND